MECFQRLKTDCIDGRPRRLSASSTSGMETSWLLVVDKLIDFRSEMVLLRDVHTLDLAETLSQSGTEVGCRLLSPEEEEERESSTLNEERSPGKAHDRCLDTVDRSVDVADKVNDIKDDSVVVSCHSGVC